jgi:hypothetical protein
LSLSAVAAAVYTHNSTLAFSIYANKDILTDQKAVDRVTKEYLYDEFRSLLQECGMRDKENNDIISLSNSNAGIKRLVRAEGFA